jgi:hypothetical protein
MLVALSLACVLEGPAPVDRAPDVFHDGGLEVRATSAAGVTPWFERTSQGFQHGWVLDAPSTRPTVAVSLRGAAVRSWSATGARVSSDDGRAWRVERVRAFDATGRDLRATLSPTSDGYAIEVDAAGAVAPVVVDPVWTAHAFVDFGSAPPVAGGFSAGDVNHDGHVDLVAVVSDLTSMRANVHVYPGDGGGFGPVPWVIDTAIPIGADNGISGSFVGDVDRDGYGDIVVGTWTDPSGAGGLRLHPGGPAGPDPIGSALATAATEQAGAFVHPLGDLDHDGYADFATSGLAVTMVTPFEVHYGGPSGPSPTTVESGTFAMLRAGDVNGDGWNDLVVHAESHTVSVYLGSVLGLSASPAQTMGVPAWVQDVADLDGDGFADLLVHDWPDTTQVHYGSPTLFAASPDDTFVSMTTSYQAVAGDTDGDGAPEVVILHDGGRTLHRGDDLSTVVRTLDHGSGGTAYGEHDLVASLGDIDGDGLDDLAVVEEIEGAWIYLGFVDQDGDGVAEGDDCDDADPGVGLAGPGWADLDGDGFGDPASFLVACDVVENALDCDDAAASVAPSALEVCNDVDDDCDGDIDEDPPRWYPDGDGDGFGVDVRVVVTCTPGEGYVAALGDCDDLEPTVWPGAPELCDGVDTDCDGVVDAVDCDVDPPIGAVSLAATAREGGGATWYRTRPLVAATASDGVGVTEMCLSSSAVCASWEPYDPTPRSVAWAGATTRVFGWFRDAAGNVSSMSSDMMRRDATAPTAPVVAATPGAGSVSLAWSASSDTQSGLSRYEVRRAEGAAPGSCTAGAVVYRGAATSVVAGGLVAGRVYGFRVCAVDAVGNTSSGTASGTPW